MVSVVFSRWARLKLKYHAAEADGISRVLKLARLKLKYHRLKPLRSLYEMFGQSNEKRRA